MLIIASGPPNRLTSLRIPFAANKVFVDLGDKLVEAKRTDKQVVCVIEGLFETRPTETLWNARTNWPRGYGPPGLPPTQENADIAFFIDSASFRTYSEASSGRRGIVRHKPRCSYGDDMPENDA